MASDDAPSYSSLKSEYVKLAELCSDDLSPDLALVDKLSGGNLPPYAFSLEIRALATHMRRAFAWMEKSSMVDRDGDSETEKMHRKKAAEQLRKARSHFDRCKLDCGKWLCIYYEDATESKLKELKELSPLVEVDNGKYLETIYSSREAAHRTQIAAKRSDRAGEDEQALETYAEAVRHYQHLHKLLFSPGTRIRELIQVNAKREQRVGRKTIAWAVVSAMLALFGVVSLFI